MWNTQSCIWSHIFWHACRHTHTHLLTCFALPFSQVASYLLPFGKCSTPLPWNIPSFISPTYLVPVGKVYSPLTSILKERRGHTALSTFALHCDLVSLFVRKQTYSCTCYFLFLLCNCLRWTPLHWIACAIYSLSEQTSIETMDFISTHNGQA